MPISLTGSLNLSGSNTLIGTKTITGSVFISGSKTIIGTTSITGSLLVTGSLNTVGTITATTLVVQTITSSISSITGSTNFGSLSSDTHKFTGSLNVTGAFYVTTGSVGIGTVSPSQKLEVVGGEIKAGRVDTNQEGGQVSFGRASDNNTSWYIDLYGSSTSPQLRFVDVDNSAVRMTMTGSNVGIGASIPRNTLQIGNTVAYAGNSLAISNGTIDFAVYMDSTSTNLYSYGNFTFNTNAAGTERMRIQSAGQLTFGEGAGTITSYKFRFNGNGAGDVMAIVVNGATASSTSYISFRTGTGEGSYKADIRYETGQLSLNNISDVRFKENIIDASTNEQWNKVKNSKLRKFDFKDKTTTNQLGFIAQELYQTIPEAISKGGDEEEFNGNEKSIWTIASTNMIPAMFGALQEAMTKIETLEARVQYLENK